MAWYRTYREYLGSPMFRAVRAFVMRRAGNVCERCHINPAAEVHHHIWDKARGKFHYPEWGTWDVPSNLEAICHDCHCAEHNKRD